MATSSLNVLITATDNASKVLAQFAKNNKKTFEAFGKVGKVMMGVGLGIGAAMYKMTSNYAKAGEEVLVMSKKTGFAVESLSELKYVAKMCDTNLDTLEIGIKKMSSTIVDAEDGLSTATLALDKLGINFETLKSMSPEQQFWTLANAIAAVEDPMLKASLAQDIFGKSGLDLLPMLAEGQEGIDALRQEAHTLGETFDPAAAAAADAFADAQDRLMSALSGLGRTIATVVLPDIQKLLEGLTNVTVKVAEWTRAHPELVKALEASIPVLVGAGGILYGLSKISKAILAINTALIIMQSLSGPKGWLILGAGIAVALGATAAMAKLMESPEGGATASSGEVWNDATQEWEPKASMASGGIVPGPIGQPVPIIAHGGEAFAGVGGGFGNVTLNVYGSVVTEDDLAERLRAVLLGVKGRNVDTGL